MNKILIIGGGNMGKTYAESFTSNRTVSKDQLYILEHMADKIPFFGEKGFHHVFVEAGDFIGEMDLIILAVKPQDAPILYPKIKPYLSSNKLILSIMAGVTMENIAAGTGLTKIIRAMPNLPAQIGMGITGFTATEEVTREELFSVQNLLNTTGKSLYFAQEDKLNAVTAISGSGPAYVFYFMEAMIESARNMGFSPTEADVLVEQTFQGAIHLLGLNNISCKEWIARVSSKGGTTEAAIQSFNDKQLDKAIQLGLQAALNRARELGA